MIKDFLAKVITINNPKSPISEAYRTLRTNIQFSSFDKEIKVLHITSAGPGEGKSTTLANLAVTFGQTGKKVLILDCDFRRPSQHKVFGLSNMRGMTNLLVEDLPFEELVQETKAEKVHLLTTGPLPPNPVELVGSKKLGEFLKQLKDSNDYDIILVDSPPALAVADALLLSSHVDGTLMVLSSGEVNRDIARQARDALLNVKANIIGVVLNKVEKNSSYSYYYYYYGEGERTARKRK
ncbi:MAG: CpsD/CapB family tyrosine-protein kinase [Peptococcales bacterium]|jgi:capsular exopolysaccharide synthesis family protein